MIVTGVIDFTEFHSTGRKNVAAELQVLTSKALHNAMVRYNMI